MARTIKVTAEKAAKEQAREAGDKKNTLMKKVREANKRRAQRIKGQKEKTNEGGEGGEKRKKKKSTKRDTGPQRNTKVSKRGRPVNQKAPIPVTS